jgi:transcriptional regulator with XRE-family HTH domain
MGEFLLRDALKALHWSGEGFARMVGVSSSTVRRWTSRAGEYPMPDRLRVWVADLAAYHERHPMPGKEDGK